MRVLKRVLNRGVGVEFLSWREYSVKKMEDQGSRFMKLLAPVWASETPNVFSRSPTHLRSEGDARCVAGRVFNLSQPINIFSSPRSPECKTSSSRVMGRPFCSTHFSGGAYNRKSAGKWTQASTLLFPGKSCFWTATYPAGVFTRVASAIHNPPPK